MVMNFAGNIASSEAWAILTENEKASLVDVRTKLELKFVGAPDLSSIGKQLISIPLVDETGQQNQGFFAEIESLKQDNSAPIIFICHGGGRSMQAAIAAAQLGYTTYNFANGFCGEMDSQGHRSKVNGWVADGLPWRQA